LNQQRVGKKISYSGLLGCVVSVGFALGFASGVVESSGDSSIIVPWFTSGTKASSVFAKRKERRSANSINITPVHLVIFVITSAVEAPKTEPDPPPVNIPLDDPLLVCTITRKIKKKQVSPNTTRTEVIKNPIVFPNYFSLTTRQSQ
jgi:hypothetical protein